jgi:glycosyltransferase involved in cell wall biosynthesis
MRIRSYAATRANPTLSVILSTFNQPEWLEKSLLGYAGQTFRDFELLVADDGSTDETALLIERLGRDFPVPLHHVWHEDRGFRKCTILNRASEQARASYLVFSDGDCIPRADFLSVHHALRQPGRFLSGGYCKLPMDTSRAVDAAAIADGRFVDPGWLAAHGLQTVSLKLRTRGRWAALLDLFSPARASWNGHNASGWKSDLLAVNGFDERMQYGGQDREFGERLENAGIRGKRIRHRAVCVHLDHPRGYATAESIARNKVIRAETRQTRSTWADAGLRQGPPPHSQADHSLLTQQA